MMAESPAIEAGRVFIPKEASWLAEFQHEVVTFPKATYDDQVDSLSQFLYWARHRQIEPSRLEVRFTPIPGPRADLTRDKLLNLTLW